MEEKITIIEYQDLDEKMKKNFFLFCEDASLEPYMPAATNMYDADWENQPHTLPYILEKTDRFKAPNGVFHILTVDNKFVACAGAYISEFDDKVALLGVRTWVHEFYRHRLVVREHVLPLQKKWAIDKGCEVVALTFNDYNKNIIKAFQRIRLGEHTGRLDNRTTEHVFFNDMNVLDYPVTIKNTAQWVAYEKLTDYDFDWESIKANEQ